MATARAERELRDSERDSRDPEVSAEAEEYKDAPAPLDHATPDSELAEAQLAFGRPELSNAGDAEEAEREDEAMDLTPAASAAPAPRGGPVKRLITFLQGSWRELQRVQWPDRRQVMQATGVVIGFVIVAGLYLGLADTVASKLVNLILQ
ncbi:MAG: preprotein translocase subunit SecE [Solirubrobacteraceae bacterium]